MTFLYGSSLYGSRRRIEQEYMRRGSEFLAINKTSEKQIISRTAADVTGWSSPSAFSFTAFPSSSQETREKQAYIALRTLALGYGRAKAEVATRILCQAQQTPPQQLTLNGLLEFAQGLRPSTRKNILQAFSAPEMNIRGESLTPETIVKIASLPGAGVNSLYVLTATRRLHEHIYDTYAMLPQRSFRTHALQDAAWEMLEQRGIKTSRLRKLITDPDVHNALITIVRHTTPQP